MREHTETVRPPRALWVTFELGRPLGIPDDPPFQRRVVKAALDLLERTDGPLIADYPEHVPEVDRFQRLGLPDQSRAEPRPTRWPPRSTGWRPGTTARVTALGRTTVGVSGLDMPAAGALVSARARTATCREAQALKEAIDDLRAYYLEAASAFPDPGTAATRKKWFWDETSARQGDPGAAAHARRQRRPATQDPRQPDADPGDGATSARLAQLQ